LGIGGSKIDVSTITVTSDEEFYANFKLIEDIRTVVHPDWFKFTMHTYDESQYLPNLSTYSVNRYIAEPVVAL
jgi:hypothetical protein